MLTVSWMIRKEKLHHKSCVWIVGPSGLEWVGPRWTLVWLRAHVGWDEPRKEYSSHMRVGSVPPNRWNGANPHEVRQQIVFLRRREQNETSGAIAAQDEAPPRKRHRPRPRQVRDPPPVVASCAAGASWSSTAWASAGSTPPPLSAATNAAKASVGSAPGRARALLGRVPAAMAPTQGSWPKKSSGGRQHRSQQGLTMGMAAIDQLVGRMARACSLALGFGLDGWASLWIRLWRGSGHKLLARQIGEIVESSEKRFFAYRKNREGGEEGKKRD